LVYRKITHWKFASYILCYISCLLSPISALAGITTGIDQGAQLPYWQYSNKSMSVQFVQRLPIQTRAYFLARGFSKAQSEQIAQSCVFQTVFKNNSHLTNPAPLQYNLRDWKVHFQGKTQGLKTREDWAKEWQKQQIKKSVQVAFEWSLYPTQQQYKAGDYNWGMSIFNLAPGSKFNLDFSWQQYGKTHQVKIRDIECAADINPQLKENP